MGYRSRIEEALKENRKGIASAADLARRAHIRESTARAYVAGERNPPLNICQDIGHALGYEGRWLFEGVGPKLTTNEVVRDGDQEVKLVPVLDEVAAGKLAAPSSQIPLSEEKPIAIGNLGQGEFFALRVKGNSMDRISPDGSIVIVNLKDRELKAGKFYVFSIHGETTFKRWQPGEISYLEPYSTEDVHKPIFIKRKRDFDVIGRAVRTILHL